jgi:hypothetical protein
MLVTATSSLLQFSNHGALRSLLPARAAGSMPLALTLHAVRELSSVDSKVFVEGDQLVHDASTCIVSFHSAEHLNPQAAAQQLAGLRHPGQVHAQDVNNT